MEVTSNILPSYIAGKATPSQQDGIVPELEKLHRVCGCELVVQGGTILKLPQVVMVTGQNILNRFFYRKSLKRFDVFSIAMGSLLLASKVEECFKTLREVLFAFHYIYASRKGLHLKPMELGGQQYTAWKNELIMIERYILKELGFSLYNIMDHPHKYILYFVKVLNGSEELANVAWSYLNDSMRLDVSLRFEAQTIACAAIFLAARKIGFPLPEDEDSGVWWEVFGATTEHLDIICEEILGLYHIEKFTWLEPIAEVEYLSPQTCAKFDALLTDEAPAAPLKTVEHFSERSNIEPFQQKLAPTSTSSTGAADGTPRTGDGDRSLTSTPVLNSYSSRADFSAAAVEGRPAGKLERKWVSVMGDIDQLDAVPAANISSSAPVSVPEPASASSRASTDRRDHKDQRESRHSRSRNRSPAPTSNSAGPRARSREKSVRTKSASRSDARRRDSREPSRRTDSRDRHRDQDDRRAGAGDRRPRESSRDQQPRKDPDRRGRADSRDRDHGRRYDSRDREDRSDRRRDDRDGRDDRHGRVPDKDQQSRRKRSRSRSKH